MSRIREWVHKEGNLSNRTEAGQATSDNNMSYGTDGSEFRCAKLSWPEDLINYPYLRRNVEPDSMDY